MLPIAVIHTTVGGANSEVDFVFGVGRLIHCDWSNLTNQGIGVRHSFHDGQGTEYLNIRSHFRTTLILYVEYEQFGSTPQIHASVKPTATSVVMHPEGQSPVTIQPSEHHQAVHFGSTGSEPPTMPSRPPLMYLELYCRTPNDIRLRMQAGRSLGLAIPPIPRTPATKNSMGFIKSNERFLEFQAAVHSRVFVKLHTAPNNIVKFDAHVQQRCGMNVGGLEIRNREVRIAYDAARKVAWIDA